jgi:prevent-host-death family protein
MTDPANDPRRAMRISATDAKNRFGHVCSEAKPGPVIVGKDGRPDTVIVSFGHRKAVTRPSVEGLRASSTVPVDAVDAVPSGV